MPSFSTEELQQLRRDTPGTEHRIHLNNAGAALMPRPVIEAAQNHLKLESEIGGYEAASLMRKEASAFYRSVGRLLNAPPQQIAWAVSATQAYNTALSAIPFKRGDALVTTEDDYVSNQIAFLQLSERYGVHVHRARSSPDGAVDLSDMARLLHELQPKLVAVTHIPTNAGRVQAVAEIGALCQAQDTLYMVDACQSAGQLPLDVQALHCDFLTATFRKFLRGPRGAGLLYVSERVLDHGYAPLFMDLHSAEWATADTYQARAGAKRFETWERSYALVLAARTAADYANELGIDRIAARVQQLAQYLKEALQGLPGLKVLEEAPLRCGILSLLMPGWAPERLIPALNHEGINASIAYRSSAVIDFGQKGIAWALRLSPHYYNTEAELDRAAEVLAGLCEKPLI